MPPVDSVRFLSISVPFGNSDLATGQLRHMTLVEEDTSASVVFEVPERGLMGLSHVALQETFLINLQLVSPLLFYSLFSFSLSLPTSFSYFLFLYFIL
jgi:hypothetical protein